MQVWIYSGFVRFGLASQIVTQLPGDGISMKGMAVRRRSDRGYDPDMDS